MPVCIQKNTAMDELLDWKHIAGPSPDLSTVVIKHVTDVAF